MIFRTKVNRTYATYQKRKPPQKFEREAQTEKYLKSKYSACIFISIRNRPTFQKEFHIVFFFGPGSIFFLVTRSRRIGDSESWRRLQKKAQKLPERKERENGDAGPQMLSYCASLYFSSAKEVSSHTICLVSLLLDDIATDKKGDFFS